MLLPIRSRVLHYIASNPDNKNNIHTVMAGLKEEYGSERQFTYNNFLDHLLSLKENGLIDEGNYAINEDDQLVIDYVINEEGLTTINKYLPKKWRLNN
ncbi:hypothetical protein ACQKTA_01935 [Enterococcus sp. 22-H-5-01]|uniref:hypothetical protein n=1 Tax=Enterococcus sp. 22-H-5-01 TaxID=3418555 RepID=UPI003D05D476